MWYLASWINAIFALEMLASLFILRSRILRRLSGRSTRRAMLLGQAALLFLASAYAVRSFSWYGILDLSLTAIGLNLLLAWFLLIYSRLQLLASKDPKMAADLIRMTDETFGKEPGT